MIYALLTFTRIEAFYHTEYHGFSIFLNMNQVEISISYVDKQSNIVATLSFRMIYCRDLLAYQFSNKTCEPHNPTCASDGFFGISTTVKAGKAVILHWLLVRRQTQNKQINKAILLPTEFVKKIIFYLLLLT